MSRSLRVAVSEDYESLVRCDDYAQIHARRQTEIATWINERSCYVGETDGTVFGFVVLEHRFFGYDFVPLFCVAREMRGKGLGLSLLEAIKPFCRSPKLFTSTNASNKIAIRLFERAGFVRSGIIENLDDEDPELVFVNQ